MAGRRSKRDLTPEERALWSKVAESVAPLAPTKRRLKSLSRPSHANIEEFAHEPGPTDSVQAAPAAERSKVPQKSSDTSPEKRVKPAATPLARLDTRTKRKLARGALAIEERLDLHGMTQTAAHATLRRFIAGAQARGARMVIVITGKGGRSSGSGYDFEERGILRRVVPQWLALPDMRDYVVGFEEAHPTHGGAGALYVRLRRSRSLTISGSAGDKR